MQSDRTTTPYAILRRVFALRPFGGQRFQFVDSTYPACGLVDVIVPGIILNCVNGRGLWWVTDLLVSRITSPTLGCPLLCYCPIQ